MEEKLSKYFPKDWKQDLGKVGQPVSPFHLTMKKNESEFLNMLFFSIEPTQETFASSSLSQSAVLR